MPGAVHERCARRRAPRERSGASDPGKRAEGSGEQRSPVKKDPPQRAVSRILFAAAALRPRRRNDHSSRPVIADGLEQPTRRHRTGRPVAPPYLALLRAGFCLPSASRQTRCALTAPFHPYPPPLSARSAESEGGRYVFCATVLRVAPTGSYPAHCPAEFGLSSPLLLSAFRPRAPARRSSVPLWRNDPIITSVNLAT